MTAKMHQTDREKSPRSRDFAISMVILLSASMIGGSVGLLIADRETSFELLKRVTGRSIGQSATQPSASAAENGKHETSLPGKAKKRKPAAMPVSETPAPEPSLIGKIDYSEQPDSASVSIEVGDVVLVRTEQLQNPDRIYFDLHDSRVTEGSMERLLARRTVPANGPLLSAVRLSLWESGAARIVLDLKRPCEYTYQLALEPSPHLTIELRAAAADGPVSHK